MSPIQSPGFVSRYVFRPALRAVVEFRAAIQINRLPAYFDHTTVSDFIPVGVSERDYLLAGSSGQNNFRSQFQQKFASGSGIFEKPLNLYSIEFSAEDLMGFSSYADNQAVTNVNFRLLRFEYPGDGEISMAPGMMSAAAQGFLQRRVLSETESRIDILLNTFAITNRHLRKEMIFDLSWQLGARPYGMIHTRAMKSNIYLWSNIGERCGPELSAMQYSLRSGTEYDRSGLSDFISGILGSQLQTMKFIPFNPFEI